MVVAVLRIEVNPFRVSWHFQDTVHGWVHRLGAIQWTTDKFDYEPLVHWRYNLRDERRTNRPG